MKKKIVLIGGVVLLTVIMVGYYFLLTAPQGNAGTQRFIVDQGETRAQAVQSLVSGGYVRNAIGFDLASILSGKTGEVAPGAYKLSASMSPFEIASVLNAPPYMKWAIVPPGWRKEQIANALQQTLGWTDATKTEFLNAYKTLGGADYEEGVYYPDTYLLPVAETGTQIAQRFILHFNDVFAPYAKEAAAQNEKWTTTLKVASLIQREALGPTDMALISGIIWNRLNIGMPLQIDASIQYALGDQGSGYWAALPKGSTSYPSPYNTYLHKGLPPTPICDPGLNAIVAALNPAKTDCLYYLHDPTGLIHCSATYAGQLANIQKYLK
ncbi:endolytic transglycosylase MltG [Patescibacteria group bacterium]|nr:endolytic transglycosylase MltG [Patescibacteria group bacterium]